MSQYELQNFSNVETVGENKKSGIRISHGTGFVLILLAIVAAVGVGLIVHFAENRKLEYIGPEVHVDWNGQTGQQHGAGAGSSTLKPKVQTEAPLSTTTATLPVRNMRLPRSFSPLHYDLKLKPDIYTGNPATFTFSGSVTIQMKSLVPSTNVTLHLRDLNITEGSLSFSSMARSAITPDVVSHVSYTFDKDLEFLIVHLDKETTKGQDYTLRMGFEGPLLDDLQGLYYSSYKQGNTTVYLAATQFESLKARKAFPCFDEPALKATFKVTLTRKRNLVSLSNMPIANTIQKGEFVDDVYQTTRKMSTYLLAFIVADFQEVSMNVPDSNVTFGVWFRPEMAGKTDYALQVGANTTANYNTFFNISFPLPKQDMVALPDFRPGAMENWGLVTYREARMLYEKDVNSEDQKETTVTYITHELGHQWFGDLVTMEWWNDIWLNEGFATFMEFLGADMLYPDWKMFDQFVVRSVHTVFDLDSYVTSHPLSSSVITADDLREVFDLVAYNKGATLIRMVRFFLGKETFQKGLQRYLSAHEYANANHNDLWRALTQQSTVDGNSIDVTSIMESWTVQMNYPVVTVRNTKGKLRVAQQRFLKNKSDRDNTENRGYMWNIPFTFTTESKPDFEITRKNITWVTAQIQDIPVPALKETDWVIANIHQYGYYRVNYDDSNWKALITQLKTAHKVIPVINRAQIIDDAWGLARAGMLSTNVALQTLEYLHKEMDLIPWMATHKQIDYLDAMFRRSSLYGDFKLFIQSKLKGPFEHFGMENNNASHVESLTRSLITELACKYGLSGCLQESQRLFEEWMTKPDSNPIDPNLRSAVYCTAIDEGDPSHWEFASEQLMTASAASERSLLMTSLTCTRSPWLISRFLQMTITPSIIRKQDAVTMLIQMSKSSVGQLLVWDFIRENWNYLFNDYGKGAFSFAGLVGGITESFNTEFQLEQLKAFHDTHAGLDIAPAVFDKMVDGIASNIQWVKDNRVAVSDWLNALLKSQSKRLTDVRLPTHLRPTMYDITLKPNMYSGEPEKFTFDGYVKIYMTAKETGSNVTLHVNTLDIQDDTVIFQPEDSDSGPSYIAKSMGVDKERQFRIFFLDAPVVAGQNYTIEMNFTGPLKNDLVGLYYSQYKRENETIYIATTQFEPTDARKAFPCFDEPQIKSKYSVKLIRKTNMKSLSNMPIRQNIAISDDFVIDAYETTRTMSTYLLAFIVCDFEYTENTTKRGVKYRAWARPESVNQTVLALDTGVKVLSHYEDYFNISFPLPKQEMIAIPDFAAGAMENWGLITYRETSMLYEPGVSSKSNRQSVEITIAHELAHQWFGDLVTMEWWDDLWLNEGFATFVEYLGVDFVSPDLKMFDQFVFGLHAVFELDSLVTSHPVFVPVKNPAEINEIFDTISYEKGGSVIRMMRFFLGEETFRKGVSIYLTNRQYHNANHDDLWEGLQTQADIEKKQIKVKDVMDTWIKQMNYPVVTVKKSTQGKIELQQQRFLSNKLAEDPGKYVSPFNYVWKIPFTCTTQNDANFNQTDRDVTWLNSETLELDDTYPSKGWIIGNIGQFGVYRVQYDEDNWKLLVRQLREDHTAIHLLNRAQIINDAFGLARAKQLPMLLALSTVRYLDKEQEYIPWHVAVDELDYIESMLAETEVYGDFQRFMKRKVDAQFKRLGITDNDDSPMESYLRRIIGGYACSYGNQACINESASLFEEYMFEPNKNPISPIMKNTVYCTAIRFGGDIEWQFLYNQYIQSTVPAEKSGVLSALSCTRNIWIINKLLHIAMNESIVRKQDGYRVLTYLSNHPVGRAVAWDFFRSHFDVLFERYGKGSFAMSTMIRGITASFNTEFRLQQMKDFHKLHPDMGTGTAAFAQAIEKTATNIRWMSDYFNTVSQWLTTPSSAV